MAVAHNNLTVSREVYDVICRQREQMKNTHSDRHLRPPTLNDALVRIIGESLTQDRKYRKYAKKDRLARVIRQTLMD